MAVSGHGKKIGLLGGSFNPAHSGHVYISEQALELLGLDEIWWLVSPQNPLKEKYEMAAFAERMQQAVQAASACKRIIVSDFEAHSNTVYTYDTICRIKALYPNNNFVWLMGADNLLQFPKWHRWRDIMQSIAIAVFNRDNSKIKALSGEVANEFAARKINYAIKLIHSVPPAWAFLDIRTHPLSSTKLRVEKLQQK